jgi:plastocyanin
MTLLHRTCLAVFFTYPLLCAGAAGPAPAPDGQAATCQAAENCPEAPSQDITGTILIKKKLTKPSVTSSVSIYQRGTAVELGKDASQDPLDYERSRVVIYLEGPGLPTNAPVTSTTFSMQQLNRRFTPDLLVVPAGSAVTFPNMDPIFHNIFSLSKPKTFDLGNYDKGESRSVTFTKPGVVYVYCHLHPNMEGTIMVTPNRWFARSDASGQFRIPNVPPGQYTVVAWHKAAGFFRKSVVVEPGHSPTVGFFIPIDSVPQQKGAMNMQGESMNGMEGR